MTKIFWILIALLPAQLLAMELDEVLDKHYEAAGAKAYKKIKTIKREGTRSLGNGDIKFAFTSFQKKDNYRSEWKMKEQARIQAIFKGEGWAKMPYNAEKIEGLQGKSLHMLKIESAAAGVLLERDRWDDLKTELVNPEPQNGLFQIKLTSADARLEMHVFISKKTWLIEKMDVVSRTAAGLNKIQLRFEYQEKEGVQFIKSIEEHNEKRLLGKKSFEKIEIGLKMKNRIFKKPN